MPRLEPWEHTTRRLIPHRSVRILPPSTAPSPSLSPPSVYVGPTRLSFSLSLASRAPLLPLLGGWFFRLAPPSVPLYLSFSLSLSAHDDTVFVYTLLHMLVALMCRLVCALACAQTTHTHTHTHIHYTCMEHTSVASSFHSNSRSILPRFSVGLSLLLRRFSAKRNPRM